MSTSCQIGFYFDAEQDIKEPTAMIYKHGDGYPEDIKPLILPFLVRTAADHDKFDAEYTAAWLLQHMMEVTIENNKELSKERDYMPKDGKTFLNFGICREIHGDICYFYRIQPGTLTIYELEYMADENERGKKWIEVERIGLKKQELLVYLQNNYPELAMDIWVADTHKK